MLLRFPPGVTMREALNEKCFKEVMYVLYSVYGLLDVFQMACLITLFGEQKFFEIILENNSDYFL